VTTAETEICIEGFPRSGNTFAVIAFQQAQPRTISIAHHVHAPGSVIAAARLGTPAIVLIREPEQAVLSMVVRYPHLSLGQLLRGYRRFYEPLLPLRHRVVVGRFEDVTSAFGSVIREVNRRFGTEFVEFETTDANLAKVTGELDRWDRGAFAGMGGETLELGRARPTDRREQVKVELRERYRGSGLARPRAEAERIHRSFAGKDGPGPNG
jgi:hypothetical protein